MTTEADRPRARRGDYITSTAGARDVARRAPNQRVKLLIQFRTDADRGGDGLNDEEAATAAGLLHTCFWKRCGELRTDGLIEQPPGDPRRMGSAGVERIVCQITEPGRAYLAAMEL